MRLVGNDMDKSVVGNNSTATGKHHEAKTECYLQMHPLVHVITY